MNHKPKISIITVVYNGEKFLEETMKSVINQNYENIEYI
ncbi:glycosyltransferase [Sulfurimonas sp.]|nr:glycosyltransferase [Sulfurimonas sp.]